MKIELVFLHYWNFMSNNVSIFHISYSFICSEFIKIWSNFGMEHLRSTYFGHSQLDLKCGYTSVTPGSTSMGAARRQMQSVRDTFNFVSSVVFHRLSRD